MAALPQDPCSMVAHDLRNAACAISIHARLLTRELAAKGVRSTSADALLQAVERIEKALRLCKPPLVPRKTKPLLG